MSDMITVIKGNVELYVPEEQKDRYLKLGYSVVDANGKIVEEATPTDVAFLQSKVRELLDENAKLKAELADAKKKPTATAKKSN